MILAGDIGGTNTRLALFRTDGTKPDLVSTQKYLSRMHKSLDEIVAQFIADQGVRVEAAAFGVAGPVRDGRSKPSNLDWEIDSQRLGVKMGTDKVWLINDLESHASALDDLEAADFITLKAGVPCEGNAALIAAGTGLGEAGLFWDGKKRMVMASEGGHADFAPRNQLEIALHQYLGKKFGHVSYERVLSGPGIRNVYDFLRDTGLEAEPGWLKQELDSAADPNAIISQHGIKGTPRICERTLEIFVSVYGAEAGNLALRYVAVGGVFLSGGIAGKLLPKMQSPAFVEAFVDKGRLNSYLQSVPVRLIVNEHIGLLGAARYVVSQLQATTRATVVG
jgi:glucokinase